MMKKIWAVLTNLKKIAEYLGLLVIIANKLKVVLAFLEKEYADSPDSKIAEYIPVIKDSLDKVLKITDLVSVFFGTSNKDVVSQSALMAPSTLDEAVDQLKTTTLQIEQTLK